MSFYSCVFIVTFLYRGTYGQLLELKLLAFLSGTLHILLFISAYCANDDDDDDDSCFLMS